MKNIKKVILLFLLGIVLVACSGSNTNNNIIDLNTYGNGKIEGTNGSGSLSLVELDTHTLTKNYPDLEGVFDFFSYNIIDDHVEKDGKLSNGDEIHIKVDIPDDEGINKYKILPIIKIVAKDLGKTTSDSSNNSDSDTNKNESEDENEERRNTGDIIDSHYSNMQTMDLAQFTIHVAKEYEELVIEDETSEYNGLQVIKIPITIENNSKEVASLPNELTEHVYGPQSDINLMDPVSAYYNSVDALAITNTFTIDEESATNANLYLMYDGEGDYSINFYDINGAVATFTQNIK